MLKRINSTSAQTLVSENAAIRQGEILIDLF